MLKLKPQTKNLNELAAKGYVSPNKILTHSNKKYYLTKSKGSVKRSVKGKSTEAAVKCMPEFYLPTYKTLENNYIAVSHDYKLVSEIDVIAIDKETSQLVVVEIKMKPKRITQRKVEDALIQAAYGAIALNDCILSKHSCHNISVVFVAGDGSTEVFRAPLAKYVSLAIRMKDSYVESLTA